MGLGVSRSAKRPVFLETCGCVGNQVRGRLLPAGSDVDLRTALVLQGQVLLPPTPCSLTSKLRIFPKPLCCTKFGNMSSASFAALRKTQGEEFAKLAEEHFKHEYRTSSSPSCLILIVIQPSRQRQRSPESCSLKIFNSRSCRLAPGPRTRSLSRIPSSSQSHGHVPSVQNSPTTYSRQVR